MVGQWPSNDRLSNTVAEHMPSVSPGSSIASVVPDELRAEPLDVRFGVLVRRAQMLKAGKLMSLRSKMSDKVEEVVSRQRSKELPSATTLQIDVKDATPSLPDSAI